MIVSSVAASTPGAASLFAPERLRRIGILWLVITGTLLLARLYGQTRAGLTDGAGHPFGEDFLNFWSAPALAVQGRVSEIYDIARFHGFQVDAVGHPIDLYHYSYPPVMLLFTAPLGWLPYIAAWAVWLLAGWLAFAMVVRRIMGRGWALYAAAMPAVFVSAAGGQNGCWTAAILGGGLLLLGRRPVLAGLILSLLVFKPQLAWLLPFALLAGGHRRALAALVAGGVASLGASLLIFGADAWMAYFAQADLLRIAILEDGHGTWHRMISTFVLVRHAGLSVEFAYGVQAIVSLGILAAVIGVWRSPVATHIKFAVLVLGALLASPYVSDYDLVAAALVPLWLWRDASARQRAALVLPVVVPLLAAPMALASGIAAGALALWPAFFHAITTAGRGQTVAGRRASRAPFATRQPSRAEISSTAEEM